MNFRHTLGLTLNPAELITDPTFSTACGAGDWICITGLNGVATTKWNGVTQAKLGSTALDFGWGDLKTVANVFQRGKKYQIAIDIDSTDFQGDIQIEILEVFVGYVSTSKTQIGLYDTDSGIYTIDFWAVEDSPLILRHQTEVADLAKDTEIIINSVSVKAYEWNSPLSFDPEIKDRTVNLGASELFKDFKVGAIEDVTYYDDGYDYLILQGIRDAVEVRIEYDNNGTWTYFYEGIIFLSECKFNKYSVTCNIESIEEICLRKNRSKTVSIYSAIRWQIYGSPANSSKLTQRHYNNPALTVVEPFDPATNPPIYGFPSIITCGFLLWRTVRDYIHELSDGKITLSSTEFVGALDEWQRLITMNIGWALNSTIRPYDPSTGHRSFDYIKMSFADLLRICDSIWNIGSYLSYDGTSYFLYIERQATLKANAVTVYWDELQDEIWEFNSWLDIGTISIGYKNESASAVYGDQAGQYIATNPSEQEYDVALSNVIRFTDEVWDMFNASSNNFDLYYLMQIDDVVTQNMTAFLALDGNANGYNGNVQEFENMNRLIGSMAYTYESYDKMRTYTGTETYFKQYVFKKYLSFANFLIIKNNPYVKIQIQNSFINTTGYIADITYDLQTNIAEIKLLGT